MASTKVKCLVLNMKEGVFQIPEYGSKMIQRGQCREEITTSWKEVNCVGAPDGISAWDVTLKIPIVFHSRLDVVAIDATIAPCVSFIGLFIHDYFGGNSRDHWCSGIIIVSIFNRVCRYTRINLRGT